MHDYARLCAIVCDCARLCTIMHDCVRFAKIAGICVNWKYITQFTLQFFQIFWFLRSDSDEKTYCERRVRGGNEEGTICRSEAETNGLVINLQLFTIMQEPICLCFAATK